MSRIRTSSTHPPERSLRCSARRPPPRLHPLELLRVSLNTAEPARRQCEVVAKCLPPLTGAPIRVALNRELAAYRGRLLAGRPGPGTAVHAAAFIRKREIVLEEALLANAPKFRLILVHELFHFVWAKLGNPARYEYARLLEAERQRGARGELGESSAVAKLKVRESRGLRDYVCESFCDTGAWLYAGVVQHPEFRLKPRWCALRLVWFRKIFASGRVF